MIRFLPTALGLKALLFIILLWTAFLAAPYANLFFLLLTFVSTLMVLNVPWTHANLRPARLTLADPRPMASGQPETLRATLHSPRRAVGVRARVRFETAGDVVFAFAPAAGSNEATAQLPALPRGVYPALHTVLESTWPLGLLRVRRSVPGPTQLVIYPAPLERDSASAHTLASLDAELASRTQLAGRVQPAGVRAFRQGDEPRRVHWKASARRASLVVLEWDAGDEDGLELVLDRRCSGPVFERRLSLLSRYVQIARESKRSLALYTQEHAARYGDDGEAWDRLYERMACLQPLPLDAPAPASAPASARRLALAEEALA